jgi:hypothetical protein
LPAASLTNVVHTVKSLAIKMKYLILDDVVDLLKLFPSLEKLHVKVVNYFIIDSSIRCDCPYYSNVANLLFSFFFSVEEMAGKQNQLLAS